MEFNITKLITADSVLFDLQTYCDNSNIDIDRNAEYIEYSRLVTEYSFGNELIDIEQVIRDITAHTDDIQHNRGYMLYIAFSGDKFLLYDDTLKGLRKQYIGYMQGSIFGASDMLSRFGEVFHQGKKFCEMSYNGRFWDNKQKGRKEIII